MRIEDRGLGRVGGRPNITTGATGQMPKHLKQLRSEIHRNPARSSGGVKGAGIALFDG